MLATRRTATGSHHPLLHRIFFKRLTMTRYCTFSSA